jgi:glucose-1-phosphate thymidylyltransferase
MQGVILAAGKGTRLHPITLTRSKAMTPIVGKPIVLRVIETLTANGVNDIVLVTNPEDREINDYFNNRTDFNFNLELVHQPTPIGMGDALRHAAPLIRDDFILSACDNLVNPEEMGRILETWQTKPSPNAILTLIPVGPEELSRMGVVKLESEWVTYIVEKPGPEKAPSNIASVPLYCFSRSLLDYLSEIKPSPRGEYELQDAIQMLIEHDGLVRGLELRHRMDLTTPEDLLALNIHYLSNGKEDLLLASDISDTGTQILDPVYIERDTIIGNDCMIGPNVYIERDCKIEDYVTIQDAVVLRGRNIPAHQHVTNRIVW